MSEWRSRLWMERGLLLSHLTRLFPLCAGVWVEHSYSTWTHSHLDQDSHTCKQHREWSLPESIFWLSPCCHNSPHVLCTLLINTVVCQVHAEIVQLNSTTIWFCSKTSKPLLVEVDFQWVEGCHCHIDPQIKLEPLRSQGSHTQWVVSVCGMQEEPQVGPQEENT